MGDEFDDCECFWSHELGIRRLLNFIRQTQDYCTDTECIDLPSLSNPNSEAVSNNDDGSGTFTTATMMLIFAMILFLMRPTRNRENRIKNALSRKTDNNDPHNDGAGPPGPAPPPPPAIN